MEPLRPVDEETIRLVRARIVETCDPKAIILFGAAAHGEACTGSDINLLVVVDYRTHCTLRDDGYGAVGHRTVWELNRCPASHGP